MIIDPQTMPMRVGIGKEPGLQHFIGAWLDAGHEMRGREGGLFNILKIILRILIQTKGANLTQRKFGMRPHFCDIKRIERTLRRTSFTHHLHTKPPLRILATCYRLKQILGGGIRIGARQFCRSFRIQTLDPLLGLEMKLDKVALPLVIHHPERVAAIPIHEPVPLGDPAIRVENRDLVHGFGDQAEKVPHHVGVAQVGLRVALLRVDKVREFYGVSDEEYRRVVAHQIPIPLLRVELHGESTWIPLRIRTAFFAPHRGKPHKNRRLAPNLLQKIRLANVRNTLRHLKVPKGTRPFGVHHALRNPLPVKMRQLVNQVKVLQHDGPVSARCERVLVISHGVPVCSCEPVQGRICGIFRHASRSHSMSLFCSKLEM
eukprot:Sdes_comp21944_c0_seq1m20487